MRGLTRLIFPVMTILAVHFLFAAVTSMQNETKCTGSIAECTEASMVEFEMDSEINRRILQTAKTYISTEALKANSVPCSVAGESYYNNCQGGGTANPYNRGCSTATNCARG